MMGMSGKEHEMNMRLYPEYNCNNIIKKLGKRNYKNLLMINKTLKW